MPHHFGKRLNHATSISTCARSTGATNTLVQKQRETLPSTRNRQNFCRFAWTAKLIGAGSGCRQGVFEKNRGFRSSTSYYETDGATPDQTVSAVITTSIRKDSSNSPFISHGKGIYGLRPQPDSSIPLPTPSPQEASEIAAPELDIRPISSFGAFWQRDWVNWKKTTPRILGQFPGNSESIDFAGQNGIYVLYDGHHPVYVGQAIVNSLGDRLRAHTTDKLPGRWTRFSWFGMLPVSPTGTLVAFNSGITEQKFVDAVEALLIEILEVPLNRKKGNGSVGTEYNQVRDPDLKKQDIANLMGQFQQFQQAILQG